MNPETRNIMKVSLEDEYATMRCFRYLWGQMLHHERIYRDKRQICRCRHLIFLKFKNIKTFRRYFDKSFKIKIIFFKK